MMVSSIRGPTDVFILHIGVDDVGFRVSIKLTLKKSLFYTFEPHIYDPKFLHIGCLTFNSSTFEPQCENVRIFLSLRFYVKSIFGILNF